MEQTDSAYGPWLAYVMDMKRVDTEKLARLADVPPSTIDDLIHERVAPDEAKQAVYQLGLIILGGSPEDRMDRVLESLSIHTDLRNWQSSCDGGCCKWNIATEVAFDAAIEAR